MGVRGLGMRKCGVWSGNCADAVAGSHVSGCGSEYPAAETGGWEEPVRRGVFACYNWRDGEFAQLLRWQYIHLICPEFGDARDGLFILLPAMISTLTWILAW